MSGPSAGPLTGFTVGITAARRKAEFTTMLERRGAQVVSAPSIRIVPLPDDGQLLTATRACLTGPLDLVVATTGIGFRGWLEAAEVWGLAERLTARLAGARLIARGPKATGAIRAAGLSQEWSPESESSADVLTYLLAQPLAGCRVAVQLHGEPQVDFCGALREAGAEVVEVPVYRWVLPKDVVPLRRLIDQVVGGGIDALAFTSAPAVVALLGFAVAEGRGDALLAKLHSQNLVIACVGPVCALPFERLQVDFVIPERARLGALVRTVAHQVPALLTQRVLANGRVLEVRGSSITLGGACVSLTPAPLALLRSLMARPGAVVSRGELLRLLPGDSNDAHAVEASIGRLRRSLESLEDGSAAMIQTVVKRGYRLNHQS